MNNAKGLMSHIGWQLLILGGFLAIWQWAYALHAQIPVIIPDLFDP
jgi:NitT/TauT family transport system permease protein